MNIQQTIQSTFTALTKLRSTLQYLEHINPIDLGVLPDLIIVWGEIVILTEGLDFDGTLDWAVTVKHIINIGIPTVVNFCRRNQDVTTADVLLQNVRIATRIINKFNHGWKGGGTSYSYDSVRGPSTFF